MRTQADIHVRISTDREVFFEIFNHLLIKTHPKHVSTPLKVSGFHLDRPTTNPSIYMSKKKLKWNIKVKLENEKSLKNSPI